MAQQKPITLKLKSKDGETFDVEKPVAMQINFVKGMLEDVDEIDGMEIPMGEVDASILAKVVEYCKFHYQQEINQTSVDEVDRWEKSFVQVDKSTLFQLILVRCLHLTRSLSTRSTFYPLYSPCKNIPIYSIHCVGCKFP